MDFSKLKKFIPLFVVVFLALITIPNSCSIVQPNQRGVEVKLGVMKAETLQPGMHWHAPYISKIRKFNLEPKTYEVMFSVGTDGAITKDMQTVGATVAVRYNYDDTRIADIITKYQGNSIIESAMKDNVKASLKETVGRYSIYDLVSEQNNITAQVSEAMLTRMKDYPIAINQTTITNWDWADAFDQRIQETAAAAQEVKKAAQELELAQTRAQKQVVDAQAQLDAQKLTAESERIKAETEAYTMKTKNNAIAATLSTQRETWEHDEKMAFYNKWDGKQPGANATEYIVTPQYSALTNIAGK